MPAIIVYLLKVNAALCLFYLAYRFALRPLTFYYLNRFFLVFGIVFSTVYPLVDISALFAAHTAIRQQLTTIVPNWNNVLPAVQHQAQTINYWGVPIVLFWLGVLLMAARLAVQFLSLYRIHRESEQSVYSGYSFRSVRSEVNPFSFWQDIYLNPDKHTDAELRSIIQHEQVHVKQWHTLDVILAELSVVFYWFNPGVWFMKQAVKENLEFITDREILRSGVDEKAYQYSLVRVSALKPGAAIVNNFNFLTIKKRIMMMNKKRSSRAHLTRYVVLPLVMLLALIFTVSKAEKTKNTISVLVKKILPVSIMPKPSPVNAPALVGGVRDTVKPKVKRDSVSLTIVKSDDGEETDTLEGPNGKKVLKNVRVVRINGKNENPGNVVIIDDKGKSTNLTLTNVSPDDIESIKVVNDTAVKAYKLSGPNNQVVVQLRPGLKLSTSVSTRASSLTGITSVSAVAGLTNDNGPKTFTIDDDNNGDDMFIYVTALKDLNKAEIAKMKELFKKNGFEASVDEDFKGDQLKAISVSVKALNKKGAASGSFSADDQPMDKYMMKIEADKTTGSISISFHNK